METPYLPPPTPLLSEVSAASHTRSLNPYLDRSFVPIQDIPYLIKGGITFCSGYSIKNLLNKPPLSSNKTRDDKWFKMPRFISYNRLEACQAFCVIISVGKYFLLGGVLVWHGFALIHIGIKSDKVEAWTSWGEEQEMSWGDRLWHGFTGLYTCNVCLMSNWNICTTTIAPDMCLIFSISISYEVASDMTLRSYCFSHFVNVLHWNTLRWV